MKWFFENKQKQQELLVEMESWFGTPYRHQCGVKGLGTDCIYFVCGCLHEVGAYKGKIPIIPKYSKDWHLHRGKKLILEGLNKQLDVETMPLDDFLNGDVILFQFGRQQAHSAIYFGGYVYQCLTGIGVERRDWNDKYYLNRARTKLRIRA